MAIIHTYDNYNDVHFWNIYYNGTTVTSSGTSGTPKPIFQPPEKIRAASKAAIKTQEISFESTIYTCTRPTHVSGLFAQTMPGLMVGADVYLTKFNPYDFVREADKFTHSHLTPMQAKGVMATKGFKNMDFTGKTFMCGAEPVTYDIIEAFVERGAKFICIWGMSEIGPNAIMHVFNNMDEVQEMKAKTPPNTTLLGNIFNCDYKIDDNNCLWVKGDICVFDDWYNTKDQVIEQDGILFYKGRDGTPVDFNKPRKG